MKKYRVTVYSWGQPVHVVVIEAKGFFATKDQYIFHNDNSNDVVAMFPVAITSVEVIP